MSKDSDANSVWLVVVALIAIIGSVGGLIVNQIYNRIDELHVTTTEVDRTQESVLARVFSLENDITALKQENIALPDLLNLKTRDRWYKSEELLVQDIVNNRLGRLEKYHPPHVGLEGVK